MVENLFRIITGAVVVYAFLWWATSNPNSVSSVKDKIDETARETVDSLTD